MSQASSTHRKQVERSILKSAKKVITESGIDPSTRSGNKELDYVVKLLAKQCVGSLAAATQMGDELGQRIVSLSQAMGRTYLDQGVLRQLRLQKDFFTGVGKFEITEKATEVVPLTTMVKTVAKPIEIEDKQQQAVSGMVAETIGTEDEPENTSEVIEETTTTAISSSEENNTDEDGEESEIEELEISEAPEMAESLTTVGGENEQEEEEEKHGIAIVAHSTEEEIEDEEGKELEEEGKENEATIDLVEQDNDEDGDSEDEKAIDLIDEDENEDENEDEEIRNEITIDLVEEEDKQEEEAASVGSISD